MSRLIETFGSSFWLLSTDLSSLDDGYVNVGLSHLSNQVCLAVSMVSLLFVVLTTDLEIQSMIYKSRKGDSRNPCRTVDLTSTSFGS